MHARTGELKKLANQCDAAFVALQHGCNDGIIHHTELTRFLVDWKGEDGDAYTEPADLDDFIYLAQNELNIPFEKHKDFLDQELFFEVLSHKDFRSFKWPAIANRIFSAIDKENVGTIGPDQLLTFFRTVNASVEREDVVSMILDLKRRETKGTVDSFVYAQDTVEESRLRIASGSEFLFFLLRGVFGFSAGDDG